MQIPPDHSDIRIGFPEFLAIIAFMMSLVAMAIDIMLPALHDIGRGLGVAEVNDTQEIVTVFLVGFALGQLIYGPLSDRHGRKPWLLVGLGVFGLASLLTFAANNFSVLLFGRFLQGIGVAATRVIAIAVVRDCYSGAQMARVMSFVMMVFIAVPIVAPALGEGLLQLGSWHTIFLFLVLSAALLATWIALRLPETLSSENRLSLSPSDLLNAYRRVLTTRQSLGYTIAMALLYSCLMGYIANAAQIFKDIYHLGDEFALVFGAIAATMIPAFYSNTHMVDRFGLRISSHSALLIFLAGSTTLAIWSLLGHPALIPLCLLISATMFFFSWIFPNFNAIAMEPLGSIAGTASSFIGFSTTAISAVLAWLVGQAFNGSVAPLALSFVVFSGLALLAIWLTEHRRLFGAPVCNGI